MSGTAMNELLPRSRHTVQAIRAMVLYLKISRTKGFIPIPETIEHYFVL